jgi:hypothetical protein
MQQQQQQQCLAVMKLFGAVPAVTAGAATLLQAVTLL